MHLNKSSAVLHAYGVCDDPDYFYDYIDGLFTLLGATPAVVGAGGTPPRACADCIGSRPWHPYPSFLSLDPGSPTLILVLNHSLNPQAAAPIQNQADASLECGNGTI